MAAVNDVEVKECLFICNINDNHLCRLSNEMPTKLSQFCSMNDCYFKQLKRLEKENRDLKKNALDTYDMYRALMDSFEISNKERSSYRRTLEEVRKIADDEFSKKLEEKDCCECDSSFWLIRNKIDKIFE